MVREVQRSYNDNCDHKTMTLVVNALYSLDKKVHRWQKRNAVIENFPNLTEVHKSKPELSQLMYQFGYVNSNDRKRRPLSEKLGPYLELKLPCCVCYDTNCINNSEVRI